MSLTLSLITALVAVLVKQWLYQYVAVVSDSSPRDRARIRHMRYAGLQKWQVPMIIDLLPFLLHVSLALFFAGLVIFLFSLGMKVAWLVSLISAATYIAYIIALILPLIHPYCPYKVPLRLYIRSLYHIITDPLILCIASIIGCVNDFVWCCCCCNGQFNVVGPQISPRRKRPLKEIEHGHVQAWGAEVDVQSLQWLYSSTSNASVHQSVLQACSGMTSNTLERLPDDCRSAFVASLRQQIKKIKEIGRYPGYDRRQLVELGFYCKALSLLCGHRMDEQSSEQLNVLLSSMTTTEKASNAFLRLLQGSRRSFPTLHPEVWKTIVNIAIPLPLFAPKIPMRLELELMKVLANSVTTNQSDSHPTTLDNLTDEMRWHIYTRLHNTWELSRSLFAPPSGVGTVNVRIRIMYSLISRIQHILLASSHPSDQKEAIEIAHNFINIFLGTSSAERGQRGVSIADSKKRLVQHGYGIIHPSSVRMGDIIDLFTRFFLLLSSEPEASDADVEAFAHGMSVVFGRNRFHWTLTLVHCYDMMGGVDRLCSQAGSNTGIIWAMSNTSETVMRSLVDFMLLLIDRHREHILYACEVESHSLMVWRQCVLRLIRWTSGEKFRQWAFLNRVLAIVVIGELPSRLDCTDFDESLPQYDYGVHSSEVEQLPWLLDLYYPGTSRDGVSNRLEYSQIAAHPKFQESLDSVPPSQDVKVERLSLDQLSS